MAQMQMEKLWPPELPTWQMDAPMSEQTTSILKDLLLETIQGKIRHETLTAIDDIDDLKVVPEPYRDLLSYAQDASEDSEDGEEISRDLLQILRVTIDQIRKMR